MRRALVGITCLWLAFGTGGRAANALDLRAPFTLENPQVLPSGVRNPRYLQVYMSVDERFGRAGESEPLAIRLNKAVTWNDVLESQSDESQKNLIRSILDDNGIALGTSPGHVSGVVRSFVDLKVPVLAWGITPKITLAAVIPVIRADVKVDTGFLRNAEGQRFVDAVSDLSPDKGNEAANKLNDATQQKLARLGYDPIRSEIFSGIGDVQLVGKYQWWRDAEQTFATKLALTLPTGRGPNADKALDVPLGDGRWKVGLLADWETRVLGDAFVNLYGGYTVMLPQTIVRRLPATDEDSLSKDKESMTRKWSEIIHLGLLADYRFESAGLVLTTGYSFQYQGKSRYDGPSAEYAQRLRYSFLENLEPAQALHSLMAGLQFSTVGWYQKKEFFLPLQLNVVYAKPFSGRDVPNNDVVSGEMVLFF